MEKEGLQELPNRQEGLGRAWTFVQHFEFISCIVEIIGNPCGHLQQSDEQMLRTWNGDSASIVEDFGTAWPPDGATSETSMKSQTPTTFDQGSHPQEFHPVWRHLVAILLG